MSRLANGRISATAKAVAPPRRPVGISAVSNAKGQSAVSWKKTDNARGYRIYRSTFPDGVFRQIKMITKGRTVTFTDRNVESGTMYYYKIRALTVNPDGSRSFGKISAVKAVKIK